MRVGKTIGGKREAAESESERMQYREKVKKRKLMSILTFFAVIAVIFLGFLTVIQSMRKEQRISDDKATVAEPTIEIVDEASVGVSRRAKEFVSNLEQDLNSYNISLVRAVLPRNKTREVDVYINGFDGYFKLSLDRGAGVSAEDLERMLRYLKGLGFKGVEYVDLRVEGKGYYKNPQGSSPEEPQQEESSSDSEPESAVLESEPESPEEESGEILDKTEMIYEEPETGYSAIEVEE